MQCNQGLEGRLNFQKNTELSHDDRLTFLFHKEDESSLSSSSKTANVWPKFLSDTDRHQNIEILDTGEARFIGPSDDDSEAASVRSDVPIPNEEVSRAVYYFEIKILSGGDHSYIGIGLSSENADLDGLPGWRRNTYGYHGDDGRLFEINCGGRGRPYGPTFTTNDTIGCGYNVNKRSCFFTKNGKCIGMAFKDLRKDVMWFPTIGMNSMGEKVEVNFGSKPFAYNIELENILQEALQKDLKIEDNARKAKKRVIEDDLDL